MPSNTGNIHHGSTENPDEYNTNIHEERCYSSADEPRCVPIENSPVVPATRQLNMVDTNSKVGRVNGQFLVQRYGFG